MKKGFLAFIFVVLFAGVVFARDFPFWGKIVKDNINLRADAGVNAQILKKLPKGFVVKVIGSAYEWYKIALPADVKAYVYKKYADVDGRSVSITGNSVNIRAGESLTAPILGQANEGDRFRFCGSSENWVCVYAGKGLRAWVHQKFVEPVSGKAMANAVKKAAPAEKPEPKTVSVEKEAPIQKQVEPKSAVKQETSVKEKKDLPLALGVLAKVASGAKYDYAIVDKEGKILYWVEGRDILLRIFKGAQVKVFGKIKDRTYKDLPVVKARKIERLR